MAFSFFSTGTTSEVNFIPEVFSKLLQAKFYKKSVLPAISNTDYQGEISGQGDKVIIRTVPAVTINDYAGTVTNQELTTGTVEMLIDKAKYCLMKLCAITGVNTETFNSVGYDLSWTANRRSDDGQPEGHRLS